MNFNQVTLIQANKGVDLSGNGGAPSVGGKEIKILFFTN